MATVADTARPWDALLAIGEPPHDDRPVHRAFQEARPARYVPLPVGSSLLVVGRKP